MTKKPSSIKRPYKHGRFISYLFLLFVIIQGVLVILDHLNIYSLVQSQMTMLWSVGMTISGGLFVWFNKEQVTQHSEQDHIDALKVAASAKENLQNKYPKLAKVPILVNPLIRWIKEPLPYKIAIILMLILGGCIYFYNLSYYDWLPDEPLVVRAAQGYLETGTYIKWDFWLSQPGTEMYERAWPHSWMVAQSMRLFEVSEWSTRLVSVLWGLIFVPIIYRISLYFLKNRMAAMVVTFACLTHPYFIVYFRRVRMYAVFVPVFAYLFYSTYKALTSSKSSPKVLYDRFPILQKFFNYNWTWIATTLVLLYFSVQLHKLTFIIFPIFLPIFLYFLIFEKQKRLWIPLLLGGLILVGLNYDLMSEAFAKQFRILDIAKNTYYDIFLDYPFPKQFTAGLLILGLMLISFEKVKGKLLALYSILGVSCLLYVYLIDFPTHYRYVLHLLPFCYMLSIGILMKINGLIPSKWLRMVIPLLIVLISMSNFIKNYEWIYFKHNEAQFTSQAYKTITQYIKPDREGIIALYFDEMNMMGKGNEIQLIDIPNNKQYTVNQFYNDLNKFQNGAWVVWATHKSYHFRKEVVQEIFSNCQRYHGYGIDETKVELLYCPK